MSNKHTETNSPLEGICNEATRQRWELFHRAIAHAKQSNVSALQEEFGVEDDDPQPSLNTVAG